MRYVEKPNLPQSRVVLAAISESAGESIKKLNSLGIETVNIKSSYFLPEPINSHADIQLLHIGSNIIFSQKEHSFEGLEKKEFNIKNIKESPNIKYPHDVRLNCAIIGDKIICNKKTVSANVLEFAESAGLTIINVNQGYSRCSICVVDEKSIITDDKSIFESAQNFFDDTLYVSKNSIRLSGYNYGFIGGCTGKIDKNKIAFNGRIDSHEDHNKIIDFLADHNTVIIELNNERLTDIGGIIPLCEADD